MSTQNIARAVAMTGQLRPSQFYTHSLPPSPPDFPTACVCVCVRAYVRACACVRAGARARVCVIMMN